MDLDITYAFPYGTKCIQWDPLPIIMLYLLFEPLWVIFFDSIYDAFRECTDHSQKLIIMQIGAIQIFTFFNQGQDFPCA